MLVAITIASILATAVMLATFWGWIRDFLNGWLRDKLEDVFGEENCELYRKFIVWIDDKIVCPSRRMLLNAYEWLRESVRGIIVHYSKVDNGYIRRTEAIIAKSERKFIRNVIEEEVPWEELPACVREEMLRRKTDNAMLDVFDVVDQKVKEKIAVMA